MPTVKKTTKAVKKPAAKKPAVKTAVKKPAAKKPAVKKPAIKKPAAAKKPAVKKPAVKKPAAAKKPAVKKPAAAKKPAVKKPAAKKPAVKTAVKKTVAKKPAVPTISEAESTLKTEMQTSVEVLEPNIKYRNLFEAYRERKLPFAQGYIVSSFFSETSFYSIYEVVSYAGVKEIFTTSNGLQFITGGKKLYILVEPDTYHIKHEEPVSRSKTAGEYIPLRFNELEIFIAKNQSKIMIAKEPIESFGSFTVLEPRGTNFAVVFYQLPDVFSTIANFFEESLNIQRKIPQSDARKAADLIVKTIEKTMSFKSEYE